MGLRKHTNLASYALGNVLKYRTKSIFILLALIFSSGLLSSVEFLREGVMNDIDASLDEGPDIIVQKLAGARQVPVPLDWKENITATPRVSLTTPRVWGYTDVGNGKLMTIMGVNATEYGGVLGVLGTEIIGDGRFLEDSDSRKIVIGQGIVDIMASAYMPVYIEIGSVLGLIASDGETIDFEVVGIFSSESKIHSYDMILTDLGSARELFGFANESSCTDFAVWVEHGALVNDVAFRLDTRIPQSRILTRDAINDISMKTYGDRAGIIALLWVVIIVSVVLLAFSVSSAGSEEARKEVGLLKALGFDTVDILEVRLFESLTLSLLGASLGVSFAIIYDFYLGAPGLAAYMLGWNLVLLNAGLPLGIAPTTIFIVYTVALVPILVATIVPSWRMAITEPDVVLRGV
jgi:ABC-type antimicrobial peptide transport system permease subunit